MPYSIIVSRTSIYPDTTQIKYLSRYNSDNLEYQCQHGYNLVIINAKSMGTILNLFIKTGNHSAATLWTINATTTGLDLISYRYQGHYHWAQSCQLSISIGSSQLSMGTILNLFMKTGNDYSLTVNSTKSLFQLRYISSV